MGKINGWCASNDFDMAIEILIAKAISLSLILRVSGSIVRHLEEISAR